MIAGDLFSDRPSSPEKTGWSNGGLSYQDIDNDHTDPQMCSMYATDIYVHLRMAEVRLRSLEELQFDCSLYVCILIETAPRGFF